MALTEIVTPDYLEFKEKFRFKWPKGVPYVPPPINTRPNRFLAENLSAGGNLSSATINNTAKEPGDQIKVPDEVEEGIDQLLPGLRSPDNVIRWSASKGVGRVTATLPKDSADEVVDFVLELLGPRENDSAWHGGCIALAELGRRGLLLPDRLQQVIPLVLKALVYDEPRGCSSVGSHIRDAACYVCWSFARVYEPHDLAPYVQDIASTLLVVTCFDKEISCRRAATTSFREIIGRQGTFPHGMEIVTTSDFYAVSARNDAYLTISVFIAQFEEYTVPLIEHLVSRKVNYWDSSVRELTAKALHNLTPQAPEFMINKVLPTLFEKTESIDLNSRHGSVLAIAQIIYALSNLTDNEKTKLPDNLIQKVKDLIPQFQEKLYFKGLSGEVMKQACSEFIEKCSMAKLPFHQDAVLDVWLALLNSYLSYDVDNVRLAAVTAILVLLNQYYALPEKSEINELIVKNYIMELSSERKQASRMGHALALGSLPKSILQPHFELILNALIDSTKMKNTTLKWADGRRDAVKALTSIVSTMIDEIGKDFSENHVTKIYDALFEGLKDYTQGKKGDIGSCVREACVSGLQVLTLLLTEHYPSVLTSDLINKILSNISQQAVEKIDRTRALSGKAFYSFIYNNPRVPNIEHYDEISMIFKKSKCDLLNWNSASATFPKFVSLLQFEPYTYNVLIGLICSIGGMTETLSKKSASALFSYLKEVQKSKGSDEIHRICETLYKIFVEHQKQDRFTVPLFRFFDKLFDSGCLEVVLEKPDSDFAKRILKLIQMEIANCKDIYKLIDGITVLCQFIQVPGEVCQTVLVQLSIYLCHRQPYIRRSTSAKLHESLLLNGDTSSVPNLDEAMQLLSDTNWENPVDEIKPIRNKLCELMNIRVPQPANKKV